MATFSNSTHKIVAVPNDGTIQSSVRVKPSDLVLKSLIEAGVINGTVAASAPDPAIFDWWLDDTTSPAVLKRYKTGAWVASTYDPFSGTPGLKFQFSATTTMADPTAGYFRLNNATLASVTAMAISDTLAETGAPDVAGFINARQAGAQIIIQDPVSPQNLAIFTVGAVTDNSGWSQVALTHVASAGSFVDDQRYAASYSASGPAGTDGTDGADGADGADGTLANAYDAAWQTATAYVEGTVVTNDGSSYYCTSNHTSGASTEPGVGASWETAWDVFAAKGADSSGDVTGPAGAGAAGNLAMFGDTSGKVVADSGQSYVKLIDTPMYAREYGLTPAGSYPGNTEAAATLAMLIEAHDAAMVAGRNLILPAGDIWTYGTSTAIFSLGADVGAINRGGSWDANGRCQIHSSYIDDASNGAEIKFQITRGALVGDLSNTNFWIGEYIHFITDNDGPQIQFGNPGDDADNIFYNKTKFGATIRSNADNAANRLATFYSYYDLVVSGQLAGGGASSPVSGARALELFGGVDAKLSGTFGGVDCAIYTGDGGLGFSNTAVHVTGEANFEQCNINWIADSGTTDAVFEPARATAIQTIVDARAGSSGKFAPINMQQEGSYSPFNRLKLENSQVAWTQNFGEWVSFKDTVIYAVAATAEEVFRLGTTIGPGEVWEFEFFITQTIHASGGYVGYSVAVKGRGVALREGSSNIEVSGTAFGHNPSSAPVTVTADTGTQEVIVNCGGINDASTYERSFGWRMRQIV